MASTSGFGYVQETIDADSATVDSAFKQVAANTGLKLNYVNGPTTMELRPAMRMFFFINVAPISLTRPDTCTYQFACTKNSPFSFIYASLYLESKTQQNKTDLVWKMMASDPTRYYLYDHLLTDLTRQQIQLNRNELHPFDNPRKSKIQYMLRNTITPFWGNHYINKNNPLYTKTDYKITNFIISLYELGAIGLISYGLTTDNDDSIKYINGGLLVACISRLVGFKNFSNISDYNHLANTPYDLSRIKYD